MEQDELLEFGRRPAPRWLVRAALFVLAGTAVAVTLLSRQPSHRHVAKPSPTAEPVLGTLLGAARLSDPLISYVRPVAGADACRLVPVGSHPDQAIAARLRAVLPDYRVHDTARTLDQLTAMCQYELRATDARGTVLLVQVVAPQHSRAEPYTHIELTVSATGGNAVSAVNALQPSGWSVTVGSVGPVADEPSAALLVRLAEDPQLRW